VCMQYYEQISRHPVQEESSSTGRVQTPRCTGGGVCVRARVCVQTSGGQCEESAHGERRRAIQVCVRARVCVCVCANKWQTQCEESAQLRRRRRAMQGVCDTCACIDNVSCVSA
jgi:hypothetical protein